MAFNTDNNCLIPLFGTIDGDFNCFPHLQAPKNLNIKDLEHVKTR